MYSRLGASVIVNDVSEKNANSVVEEIKKGRFTIHVCEGLRLTKVSCSWG